ncbi:MAG TPA: CPBP family intramembrane glutamic endopeptidase [Actinomycetota bacterium]
MTSVTSAAPVSRRRARGAATPFIVVLGCALLLLRLRVLAVPGDARPLLLAAILGSVAVASLLTPVPSDRPRLPRRVVLGIGLAGVGAAALAAGRPVAFPSTAWAIPLALLAAVAEEALLRRVLYARLEPAGIAVAIGVTAALFALLHVPLYGWAAFPVDLGAGLLLSWQRWASGIWTVPAATHAAANLLATVMR